MITDQIELHPVLLPFVQFPSLKANAKLYYISITFSGEYHEDLSTDWLKSSLYDALLLKYVFRMVKNASRAVGQNSLTPWAQKLTNSIGNNNLNFELARDQAAHLETAENLCTSRPDVEGRHTRWD